MTPNQPTTTEDARQDEGVGHTPGPWEAAEVRTSVGRAFRIGAGEMLAAGKGCCIIYDDYPGNPDNERAANARLIAAAPDLLQSVKSAETFRDDLAGMISKAFYQAEELGQGEVRLVQLAKDLDDWMHDGTLASYRDEFEAAIAKATRAEPHS